ncbi:MAG: Flp family type IVb pilin [Rhodospirillaceae bacterium]
MPATSRSIAKISVTALAGRRGATAIEYCLIAAGIALAIVTAVPLVGGSLSGVFATVASAL